MIRAGVPTQSSRWCSDEWGTVAGLGQVAESARLGLDAQARGGFLSWCVVNHALSFARGKCYIRAMKKILFTALLLTVFASSAFAAGHRHHHHHHHHAAQHPHA
jgi:hypothetical protein